MRDRYACRLDSGDHPVDVLASCPEFAVEYYALSLAGDGGLSDGEPAVVLVRPHDGSPETAWRVMTHLRRVASAVPYRAGEGG
jgi:hypothetical protein